MMGRGDTAYVRGELGQRRSFRLFREAKALTDPKTKEVLGYEAAEVGTTDFVRTSEPRPGTDVKTQIVPHTFTITNVRQEAVIGDRLAPTVEPDYRAFVPHAPKSPIEGLVVSIYGDGVNAGQNQIVSINKGSKDGIERGNVLALWRAGVATVDRTDKAQPTIQLPDEKHGLLFVFSVFDRVSYGLILSAKVPVRRGDRLSQP